MSMGTFKENTRHNIVSLRVSDEDLRAIKILVTREHITISDLMRDALKVVRQRLEELEPLPPAPAAKPGRRRTMSGLN